LGLGTAAEPLGVGGVGGGKDLSAAGLDLDRAAIVHGGWGVVADAGMAVFVVVVAEENRAEAAGILDRAEVTGERRTVFQGFELGLAVGIVVGHVRSGMRLVDPEHSQHGGYGLGGHGRATVGVDGARPDTVVLINGVIDECLGEFTGLGRVHFVVDRFPEKMSRITYKS
jgi:hypothetical protein